MHRTEIAHRRFRPKFSLFDRVMVPAGIGRQQRPETITPERAGTITGIHYVTKFQAAAQREPAGWVYKVDFFFGNSPRLLLGVHPDFMTDQFRGSDGLTKIRDRFSVIAPDALDKPSEIEPPVFSLFDTVTAEDGRTGVLCGVEYLSMFECIANGWTDYGLEYRVDFHFALSARDARDYRVSDTYPEHYCATHLKLVKTSEQVAA